MKIFDNYYIQGCNQIRLGGNGDSGKIWGFKKNQGILFLISENQVQNKDLSKIRENRGSGKFHTILLQDSDFPYFQSYIPLNVIVAKFYPLYHSVLRSCYEMQFRFAMKPKM